MSSVPPSAAPVPHAPPPRDDSPREITIISHSNMFYWWPVWAIGFIMAALTWLNGDVMAVLPGRTATSNPVAKTDWKLADGTTREGVLVEPIPHKPDKADRTIPRLYDNENEAEQPHLFVAPNKMFGVIFSLVLLLVIVITNVPLRGMWSVFVILMVIMFILIVALADKWKPLLELMSRLDVRITMGGYFLIAGILFIVWLLTMVFFDRQTYISFTPGQLKVSTEIGGGEKVYDATGMTLEKQRSDLFRHWILGLGSGDLVVRTSGAQAHQFDLPNVLFIGRKVAAIEELLKKKSVVESR